MGVGREACGVGHQDATHKGDDALTVAQHRAVVALLTEPTLQDAAKSVGVDRSTIYRWFQQPAFQVAYREARHQALSRATARLQQISSEAVEVLREVMNDQAAQPAARVGAAKTVLDMALEATEVEDLSARVEALEQEAES